MKEDKETVHCISCFYLSSSNLKDVRGVRKERYICDHPTNIVTTPNWLEVCHKNRQSPASINARMNCKNFKPRDRPEETKEKKAIVGD